MYIHLRFKNIVYLFPLQFFDLHISFSNLCILAVQSTFESDCALASALPGNETRQSHDPHMAYLIGPHATHDELPDDQKRVACSRLVPQSRGVDPSVNPLVASLVASP